jgi:hypothetical protein
MTLHKLTAGDGYTYLTRQVAAHDATTRGSGSLGDYYSEKGEAPGVWMGRGLAGVPDFPVGERVTEAQMVALFGAGRHPNAEEIERTARLVGKNPQLIDQASRLGAPYRVFGESGPRRGRCISIGHSYGGCVALQAAIDHPEVVSSLVLLEPALFREPDKGPLRSQLGRFVAMHRAGDDAAAVDGFWSFVGGPCWREDVSRTVPGAPNQAVVDAAAAFDSDIPSAPAWRFGAEEAAAIVCPALHVLGSDTLPVFRAGADLLCSWLPRVERVTLPGANHLLHVQQPERAAALIADFVSRH